MGPIQWLIVGIVVLLLFGNRLPNAMRSLGQGMKEFKKGLDEGGKEGGGDEPKKVEDNSGKVA
jgi:sec-independent protein translocase protein TatA